MSNRDVADHASLHFLLNTVPVECQRHILFHGIDLHQYRRRPINLHHRLPPQQPRPPNVLRVRARAGQDHFANEKRQRRALGR